jgi:pullulanase/glycogen debranching enzyme
VNFALFSERATGVELCLFDHPAASQPVERLPLRERTDLVWHNTLDMRQSRTLQLLMDSLRYWVLEMRRPRSSRRRRTLGRGPPGWDSNASVIPARWPATT